MKAERMRFPDGGKNRKVNTRHTWPWKIKSRLNTKKEEKLIPV